MTALDVLIVGGGIGGLSTAIAIRQQGHEVTVLERSSDLHSSVFGVGIIQPINALRALDAIGVADACLEHGYAAQGWGARYDVAGNFVREIPGVRIDGFDFPPMNGITRPKLHEILTDRALDLGVRIRYGTTFASLADRGDRVDVEYRDGTTESVDIVVGADGVHSKVRPYVLGHDVEPTYIGQSAFRMTLPRLPEIDRIITQMGPAGIGTAAAGAFGMAGFVPIGKELAYMFYNMEMPAGQQPDPADYVAVLREELAEFGGITGQVRDAFLTDDAEVVLHAEESMIVPAPWHKGRIVLIGDAVHAITPHLGQGAAQAIEDGVVLGDVLGRHEDLERAFTEYAERRVERCRLVVDTSRRIAEWEQGTLPDFDHSIETQRVLEAMVAPL